MPHVSNNTYNENIRNKKGSPSSGKSIWTDGSHSDSKAPVRGKRTRRDGSRYVREPLSKILRTPKQDDAPSLDYPKEDQNLQSRQPSSGLIVSSQDDSTKRDDLGAKTKPVSRRGSCLGSSSSFFASMHVPSQGEMTLGNGDCLYNAVALGIRDNIDLQASLHKCLMNLDFKAFKDLNPHSSLSVLKLSGLSSPRKKRQLDDFLIKTLTLPSVDLQKCLAPILRFIAVSYLQCLRGRSGMAFCDAAILKSIASEYQRRRAYRDDTYLLHHDFIRDKLNALIAAHNPDVPEAFAQWFEQEGKISYLNAIKYPATHAGDRARWGAEIELGALARALNTNMTWEKGGIRGLVGVLAGIVPVSEPGRADIKPAVIDKLVRLDIAEEVSMADNAGRISRYLRFMPQADIQLAQHTGVLVLPGPGDVKARIGAVIEGCTEAQALVADDSELTVYGYLSRVLSRPDIALCYKARGILTDRGRFITDEQGAPDVERIAILAQGLTRGEVAMVHRFIQPVRSSLTLCHNGIHWSYVPTLQALVLRSSVRSYNNSATRT